MEKVKLSRKEIDERMYVLEGQSQKITRKIQKLRALSNKWELLACVPALGRCFETSWCYYAVIDLPRKQFNPDGSLQDWGRLNPYQLPCIRINKSDVSADSISEDAVYRCRFPGFEQVNDETAKEITVEQFIEVMQAQFDHYVQMIRDAAVLRKKLEEDENYLEQDKSLASRLSAQAFEDPSDVLEDPAWEDDDEEDEDDCD